MVPHRKVRHYRSRRRRDCHVGEAPVVVTGPTQQVAVTTAVHDGTVVARTATGEWVTVHVPQEDGTAVPATLLAASGEGGVWVADGYTYKEESTSRFILIAVGTLSSFTLLLVVSLLVSDAQAQRKTPIADTRNGSVEVPETVA